MNEYRKINRLCDVLLEYCMLITEDTGKYTKAIKQINESTRYHKKFSPLSYCPQNDDFPVIDKIALIHISHVSLITICGKKLSIQYLVD